MNLEIYLTRHGQTEFNALGRVQGWCDSLLTEAGKQEAERLGNRLQSHRFDAAFSSNLPRAVQTAHLVLQGAGQPLAVTELKESGQ